MAHFINDPRTGRLVPAEAQAQGAVAPSRLDRWTRRERPRVETTLGYSRFVRIMKVTLPLVAFSLVVLVVIYSATGGAGSKVAIGVTELGALENDRQLVNPKLTGTDGRGQPFTVTAKSASQVSGKARKLAIDGVVADVTMQDRSWISVGATHGVLDVEGKTLDLNQTISIFTDKGYECHTESARYDFGLGLLKGEQPINCQGPLGLMSSKKFEGLREPGIMRFTGGVTTTYFPTPREGLAADAATTNPEGIAEALPDDSGNPEGASAPGDTAAPAPASSAPVQPKAKPATP